MSTNAEVVAKLDMLIGMVKDVQAEQKAQADRLSRLEGQSAIMLAVNAGPSRLLLGWFTS